MKRKLQSLWIVIIGAALLHIALFNCAHAQVLTPNPILFATQYPVPYDFASIGSVFANHRADLQSAGRGGDLYIRYGDGTLRNLTAEAGFGVASGLQGSSSISVRDPAVHWSGTKAVFSMVIGGPNQQYQVGQYYWQLYEVSGLGQGDTVSIIKLPQQPADYNNVQPIYDSQGRIVFVSDRPRNGQRHLYPQHDEYESTPTPTGLWRLNTSSGELVLLQHSPSGSFTPILDSFGRILFTRWDHLQRDQQNEGSTYGTFNFSGEGPSSIPTAATSEVFPEPRISVPGSNVSGLRINHFFPWQIRQDGTGEETLNHVGRQELHSYFEQSFTNDPSLKEFIGVTSGRVNLNSILNTLYLSEDPNHAGRYLAIDAPEFNTYGSGQLIRIDAPPSKNPDQISVEYLTHRDTEGTTPSANHTGHYRDPLVLSDGRIIASHASEQGGAENRGTRSNPNVNYEFRLRLVSGSPGSMSSGAALTTGISKNLSFWDPDVLVSYNSTMWELQPVELVARSVPPDTSFASDLSEQSAYTLETVSEQQFRDYFRQRGLAIIVMRNVTTRDGADTQQPYNLRVPGGVQTTGNAGTLYDIGDMQFFQGDQIRGIGGMANPNPGRRVLAQALHDTDVQIWNPKQAAAPDGSVKIFADGSVAVVVPARRAMTWQSTAPDGTPVVRERYWLSFQPGEVRACDGCHGVNSKNQNGQPPAQNIPLAFRDLLARWKAIAPMFQDGFEGP